MIFNTSEIDSVKLKSKSIILHFKTGVNKEVKLNHFAELIIVLLSFDYSAKLLININKLLKVYTLLIGDNIESNFFYQYRSFIFT